MRWMGVAVMLVGLCACSDDTPEHGNAGGGGGGGTVTTSGSTTSGAGGGGPSGDWQTLIAGDWTLAAGTEAYSCVIATVPEEMYIARFRPIAPSGTHHTVLTRAPGGPDGTFGCDAGTNGQNMIYGSGVGENMLEFPPGVAVKIDAGEKILLNLHLFNVSPSALGGTSGVEVQLLDPADVEHEAHAALAGTQSISLDPMSAGSALGVCTVPSPVTLFALMPHMHQLGVHMNISVNGNTLLDGPYTFDDQLWSVIDPVALDAGDQVVVDCSYDNTTNNQVNYGDSSTQEMCFAGMFVYPTNVFGFICDG